jgi:hypothetical protein
MDTAQACPLTLTLGVDVGVVGDGDVAGRFVAHGHVQVAVAVHVFVMVHAHVFVHAHVSGFAHARLRPAA